MGLLAEQALRRMEVYARADVRPETIRAMRDLREEQRQQIAALLGEQRALRYQRYADSEFVRSHVQDFRSRLYGADVLSDEQTTRLVGVMQEERERFLDELNEQYKSVNITSELGSFMASDATGVPVEQQILEQMNDYDRRMISAAQSVLSAEQLRVFKTVREERLAHQRAFLRMMTGSEQEN